jgi:hypothetical protein
MGDDDEHDKSIVEKTIETVKNLATTARHAAKTAMEPDPLKPGDRIVIMPLMDTGLMADPVMPPFVVIPRGKKPTSKKARKTSSKKAAKGTANKSAKKSTAKKKPTKPLESPAGRTAVAKKIAKKKKVKRSGR